MYRIESVKISDIDRTKNRVKKHPADQIKRLQAAIRKYGFTVPVVIDANNMLLAGEGRIQAALGLEMDEVPAIRVPLSGPQALEYIIAENRLTELGIVNEFAVAEIIKEIKEISTEIDFYATGYSRTQIADILGKLELDINAGLTLDTDIDSDDFDRDSIPENYVEITPPTAEEEIAEEEQAKVVSQQAKTIDENGVRISPSNLKRHEVNESEVDINSFDLYTASISGGKDSTALLLWAIQNLDRKKIIAVYWDSGWNIPECSQYVYYLCRKYKVRLILCGEKNTELLYENIRRYGYPSYAALWCQHLKTSALDYANKYIRDNISSNMLCLMGLRRSESIKRSDVPTFARFSGLMHFVPLADMTDDELIRFIDASGEKIPPIYNFVNRTGCLFCPNASIAMKSLLKQHYPRDLCKINEYLVAGLECPNFRKGFVELVKSFNRYRDIEKWPNEFKDIAFSYDEFRNLDCRVPDDVIDLRGAGGKV